MATVIAKATYDYLSEDENDLPFRKGEKIEILRKEGEWWFGKNTKGKEGLFPFNRVEVVKSVTDTLNGRVLANPSPEDTISNVKIEAKKVSKKGHYNYTLTIFTSGKQVKTDRFMSDLRKFDRAIRLVDPMFHFRHTLPPEWADELPVTDEISALRLNMLQAYFFNKRNLKNRQFFDFFILLWARLRKESIKNMTSLNDKVLLLANDTRQIIESKCLKAISYVYSQSNNNLIGFFIGENKLGTIMEATFPWDSKDDDNKGLSFTKGDLILVVQFETPYNGWWYGQRANGHSGLFPSNYVKAVSKGSLKRKLRLNKSKGPGSAITSATSAVSTPATQLPPGRNMGNTKPTMVSTPVNNGPERPRKIEENFFMKSIEAYDELSDQGFTIEKAGRHLGLRKIHTKGTAVTLDFSAYVWDPQGQILREFSSSDKLSAPPKGIETSQAGRSGIKMEFTIGREEVNDGLEEIVQRLEKGATVRGIISPAKGYGDVGVPPEIPGNTYLVYDLTMISVSQQGTNFPQPRNQIFSVGISKSNVQIRPMKTNNGGRGGNRRRRKQNQIADKGRFQALM